MKTLNAPLAHDLELIAVICVKASILILAVLTMLF